MCIISSDDSEAVFLLVVFKAMPIFEKMSEFQHECFGWDVGQ